jgi:hypothetical protein
MITNENWIEFIQTFFGVSCSKEWLSHVALGWNHKKVEPGCNCSFTWYSGPVECEDFQNIKEAKLNYEQTTGEIIPSIDVDGVEQYLQRDDDNDEPIIEVITTESDEDKKQAVEDFEDEEPSHGYWEKGDH